MTKTIETPAKVKDAQVLYVSHSGGKDSQATLATLVRHGFKGIIKIIHSDLGEMEWEPMHNWIEQNSFGLPVHTTRANEDFFQLVERTKRFPSGHQQYCTYVLKTQPIKEWIHADMKANGYTIAINVTGMRAQESERRAGKLPFSLSQGEGTSGMHMPVKYPGHTVYDWHPIHSWNEYDVLKEIRDAGQELHHVYSLGFSRLSCVFCVNGRIGEHKKAAELRPELANKMAALERKLGKALRLKQVNKVKLPKYLDEYTNAKASTN